MTDPVAEFREAMAAAGVPTSDPIIADGRIHRVTVNGDKPRSGNGWYILHLDDRPAGAFGCHKRLTGETVHWTAQSPGKPLTREVRKSIAEASFRKAEELRRLAIIASQRAGALWNAAVPARNHPYLARKRVPSYGLRQADWEIWNNGSVPDALVIPISDVNDGITSLQGIFAERHEINGTFRDKVFLHGGRTKGCYYEIPGMLETIYIAEGYATAATVRLVTRCTVIVAFNCGNLTPVAEITKHRYPQSRIIIAADDDRRTPGNPGLKHAHEAAKLIGAAVARPIFGLGDDEGGTDWNDLYIREGLPTVLRQLMS